MRCIFRKCFFFIYLVLPGHCLVATGQSLNFFHLKKSDGLSDNLVTAATLDQTGILWVGTSEGLDSYDGRTVRQFSLRDSDLSLPAAVMTIVCDKKNQLWILFDDKSIGFLDEKRIFHKVKIVENGQEIKPDYLLPWSARGILFLQRGRLYKPDRDDETIVRRVSWDEDDRIRGSFERINLWDADRIVFSGNDYFCILDMRTMKVTAGCTVPSILAAARLSDSTALITTHGSDKLCLLDISSGKILERYGHLKDQFGDEMKERNRSIYYLNSNNFIITSAYAGVYVFNAATKKLVRYQHDPLNPRSVSANNTSYIFSDTSGYFFVTSNTGGLNFFNTKHSLAGYKPAFRDEENHKIFDGYINCVSEAPDGNIWLGGQNSLIQWNPQNNRSVFIPFADAWGNPLQGNEEVRSLHFDGAARLWIGLNRHGVVLMNRKKKIVRHFRQGTVGGALRSNLINHIVQDPGGVIWIASAKGIDRIDPRKLEVISERNDHILRQLENKNCNFLWFGRDSIAWVATDSGVACVDMKNNFLKFFGLTSELRDLRIHSIAGDEDGNLYFATSAGVDIFKNGRVIRHITTEHGLQSGICEGVIYDGKGTVWIGNNNVLAGYDTRAGKLRIYDQAAGLSEAGFRRNAFHLSRNGIVYWGSDIGVSYFKPHNLKSPALPVRLLIQKVSTPGRDFWPQDDKSLTVPYSSNSVSFDFTAVDISGADRFKYQYKLTGIDRAWQEANSPQPVRYPNLPPGSYSFLVRASGDGIHWTDAEIVWVRIEKPWWMSGIFIAVCLLILLDVVSAVFFNRTRRKLLLSERLETERAINYFATTMYGHEQIEDILWQVARDCISRLGFEDCVIYLKDPERQVLIQKAAWGPKTTDDNRILNPLEIPLGKGIVGQVALNGRAEIVPDTSLDTRYIVDDKRRLSELCVLIEYNAEVLGVIDSENSKKNFFNHSHLSILTTIASLCANKIVSLRAEKEKQEAKLASLNYYRRVAEEQLKSLRLQMNPHFLFNSLNSIQQIILSGDEKAATLYLSKFSRLLRLVLSHSDRDKVSLKEELETLSLYVELEGLRFSDSFYFNIECDNTIDPEEIYLPTLLIQPFVENAIWHGLLHKAGERYLKIRLREDHEKILCEIEDNGIGRDASKTISSNSDFESRGISIAKERIDVYNKKYMKRSKIDIYDLHDGKGAARGTRVVITLPVIN